MPGLPVKKTIDIARARGWNTPIPPTPLSPRTGSASCLAMVTWRVVAVTPVALLAPLEKLDAASPIGLGNDLGVLSIDANPGDRPIRILAPVLAMTPRSW